MIQTKLQPAVFLDRDGTLIEDVGFIHDTRDIHLYPDTVTALKQLQTTHLLFVITNQSGVADGFISIDDVSRVNEEITRILSEHGITIQAWYVCPHNKAEGCQCHKPKPGLLLNAAESYSLDFGQSFVIGDHPHDTVTSAKPGLRGCYLLTGHGAKHRGELPCGTPIFQTLGAAADWICTTASHQGGP